MKTDILVIGGGSAGMSAALSANKLGAKVVICEREAKLGGILKQCIHNGFGLKYFKTEMTGPEYANALAQRVAKTDIGVFLEASVLELVKQKIGFRARVISPRGVIDIEAKAVVLAMGCREKSVASISLCGTRPVGVMTAGAAQKIINIDGKMIGKRVVIVGSGDVGLIMARRLHFEGAKVLGVYEISANPSGLNRNIVQCLNDYKIPLYLSETVVEIKGENRVEGVVVAKVNPDFSFDMSTKRLVKCDTVLLSVGLVPDNNLVPGEVALNSVTGGATVDDNYMTSENGVFSCGNVLHVHDIVDDVTMEAELAGASAARYVLNQIKPSKKVGVAAGNGVRYVVPSAIGAKAGFVPLKLRVGRIFRDVTLQVSCGGAVIASRPCKILLPAQMEQIMVDASKLSGDVVVEVK